MAIFKEFRIPGILNSAPNREPNIGIDPESELRIPGILNSANQTSPEVINTGYKYRLNRQNLWNLSRVEILKYHDYAN
jgi:hypothetical protein